MMETPTGSFYRGGCSLTPTLSSAMTPPTTPSSRHHSQNINMNQKLDLMLSMFMEQKQTAEETKVATAELQKHVVSLSSELLEVKDKVNDLSTSTQGTNATRKKIPPQLSGSVKQLHDKSELQFHGKET